MCGEDGRKMVQDLQKERTRQVAGPHLSRQGKLTLRYALGWLFSYSSRMYGSVRWV